MSQTASADYPLTYSVDYPDRPLNRLTTAFRIIVAIPILIVLAAIGGLSWQSDADTGMYVGSAGGGILFLPTLLMIVFRQKYPRWWYDFNLHYSRFSARVVAYLALQRDEYPSTDEEQAVRLDFPYPNAQTDLNRWLPLVKWLLAVPHYIVLFFLAIAALIVVVIAWFAILFTGRYPRGLFDFIVGFERWGWRVAAYAFLLVTDTYPPFSLQGTAPPAAPAPEQVTF